MATRRPTLIVDNYDSYTHNLYQMCWTVSGVEPFVIRNNEEERFRSLLGQLAFDNIIISPGPGSPDRPQDFGICAQILKAPPAPVLGVCLGCQGIGWMYGLDVRKAPGGAVHGRTSAVFHNEAARGGGGLFAGIPNGFKVVRYHSLAICSTNAGDPFPEDLERTAWTADGVLMGLQHRKLPLWGVQFHPESICTEFGAELLSNFLALADAHNSTLETTHSNASTPPSHARTWQLDETLTRLSSSSSSESTNSARPIPSLAHSRCSSHETGVRGGAAARDCGHLRLKLVHRVMDCRLEPETFYMTSLSNDKRSFWLDSSRREHGVARFSYMGGSTGPLSYQVHYNLKGRRLQTTYPDGRIERRECCDVLGFLEDQLLACKLTSRAQGVGVGGAEGQALPFEFVGGFVGYLGYELKELCEDGLGEKNRHVSEDPDAVMLFADRFLVWDHQEGHVYVAALVDEDGEGGEAADKWLDATVLELKRLQSLSLRDTLAERHKAMRAAVPDLTHTSTPQDSDGVARLAPHVRDSAPAGDINSEQEPGTDSRLVIEGMDSMVHMPPMMAGEDRASGDEPPTVAADDGEDQEPSDTPAGPGALSFPPVQPNAPQSLSAGPGSAPRGAMPHAEGVDSAASSQRGACGQSKDKDIIDLGFATSDSEEQYQDKVRQCLGHILEGESYELCMTTRHRSRRGMRVDPLLLYQRLRAVNPAPYSALLRCGEGLTVCSSSPERFLRMSSDGLCDSKPIKGTRRRGACMEEDEEICKELKNCEKDLAENLMIVDLVRNDFGRVCTEASVCCPKIMDVETYATVHQLVSTIQGQKRPDLTCIDVIRATFPMGSMTGAPKRRSLVLLDELEGDARGIYSGALGFFSLNGAVHFSVAIRTAVVTDEGVKVGAGGAITILSDPQDEWDEMQLKASALLSCAHAVASGGVPPLPPPAGCGVVAAAAGVVP